MNKLSFMLAIFMALLFTSCNSTKDKIVGKWEYNQVEYSEGLEGKVCGVVIFHDDGKNEENAKATCKMISQEDGESIGIKATFTLSSTGDWEINDKEIAFSPNTVNMDVTSISYFDPETEEILGNLTGSDFYEVKNKMISDLKSKMMEAYTERIIMLQKNKFVTETEDDGEKITCTYKRLQ